MDKLSDRLRISLVYIQPLIWTAILLVVLNFTNPLQSGPTGVLVVFCLLYLAISGFFYMIADLTLRSYALLKQKQYTSSKRVYYISSTLALAPVFLLALSTLGSLDWQEVLLVFLLVGAGCFYVVRQTNSL